MPVHRSAQCPAGCAFKLEWPDGSVEEYTTEETDMLKKASIGDHLVKTQTERLVISVSRPDQE
jgi:hypothetical protein